MAADEPAPASKRVWVEASQLFSRIPAEIRNTSAPTTEAKVWFEISDLTKVVAESKTSIPADLLSKVCPELLSNSSAANGKVRIPFPWHQVVGQIRSLSPAGSREVSEKTAAAPTRRSSRSIHFGSKPAASHSMPQHDGKPAGAGGDEGALPAGEALEEAESGELVLEETDSVLRAQVAGLETLVQSITAERERGFDKDSASRILARERDAAVSLKDAMEQDLHRVRESAKRQIESLQERLAQNEAEHRSQCEALRAEISALAQSKREISEQLLRNLDEHRRQMNSLQDQCTALKAELARTEERIQEVRKERQAEVLAAFQQRDAYAATSQELSSQLIQTRENARVQADTLTAQFGRAAEEHKQQIESLLGERDRLRFEREKSLTDLAELQQRTAALIRERDELTAKVDELRDELINSSSPPPESESL